MLKLKAEVKPEKVGIKLLQSPYIACASGTEQHAQLVKYLFDVVRVIKHRASTPRFLRTLQEGLW